uniref:33 kDa inner dynein arm light chain, axonemal n=2 Tax=Lygus hesperus TaxID=30085 RepID=A0A0A9YXF9_LYGHE
MNCPEDNDVDIEKRIEYEIRCGELIQHMFNITPVGPGGDVKWSASVKVSCSERVTKTDPSATDSTFVDFIKYEDPVRVCGCVVEENMEIAAPIFQGISTKRTNCGCFKATYQENHLRKMLNTIRTPQVWKTNDGVWRKQISSTPVNRRDVLEINKTLDALLEKQLAQERGVCPARRHLFNSLLDEMIRQEMIIMPERGLLLMTVKDELKMSLMAYEALYEQGLNYGMQKRLEAENMLSDLKEEHDRLVQETSQLKKSIKTINDEFKDQKVSSEQSVKAVRTRAKMELQQLQEIKKSLQMQMNQTIPEIERIEKERRIRQLM